DRTAGENPYQAVTGLAECQTETGSRPVKSAIMEKRCNVTIGYGSIILRDFCEADITDYIRWMTEETAWQDWDAPWEKGLPFDAEQYRKMKLDALRQTAADANLRRS